MPEPIVKPYKAQSIEQLKEIANESRECMIKIKSFKAEKMLSSMKRILEAAYRELKKCDQEMAYIYFMRYINCFVFLNNYDDYDEKFTKCMYGSDIGNAFQQLQSLDSSLRNMYSQLQKSQNDEISNVLKETKDRNNKNDKLSQKIIEKSEPNSPSTNGFTSTEQPSEDKVCITSKELYDIATKNIPKSLLIIDIRLKEHFHESSMNVKDVINVPENLIEPGCIASKFEEQIEETYKSYFKKRGEYDQIVVIDWFSTKKSLYPGSKIYLMLTIFSKWDIKTKYKNKPVILEGGYDDWLSRYPTWTTDAYIVPPRMPRNDSKISLENIDYPVNALLESKKDIVKNPTPQESTLIPTIDRTTKPVLQEKKTENVGNGHHNSVDGDKNIESTENTETNDKVIKKTTEQIKDENNLKEKSVSFENDEEDETKTQYCSGGRRTALTTPANQSTSMYSGFNSETDDEETYNCSDEDKEKKIKIMKTVNNLHNETSSSMKRYSSTPNISKLIDEYTKPPIDRSTKPSNDDQLNFYTMGRYNDDSGKGLTGLKNLGNTCYMNSIIQCLSNTEPLRKKLLQLEPRLFNDKSKTRGLIAREIINIMKQLWSGDSSSVSCKALKNIVGEYRDTFKGYEQQDSHEFLVILIDWLHEDLNEPSMMRSLDGADEKSGEKAWGEFVKKNNSVVRQLFYGQLKSTVCCTSCKKQSVTFEPFSNLSLPLPSSERCSLADCLKLYTGDENILGWQCPDCKILRNATKKLDITKLPPLLVIHFKRFTSNGWCRKRVTNVDFPDLLDMTPYITGREHRNRRYQLYAISNHFGTMESGHYTAYCINSGTRRWYKFDDQDVSQMPTVTKSPSAYIVFYQSIPN